MTALYGPDGALLGSAKRKTMLAVSVKAALYSEKVNPVSWSTYVMVPSARGCTPDDGRPTAIFHMSKDSRNRDYCRTYQDQPEPRARAKASLWVVRPTSLSVQMMRGALETGEKRARITTVAQKLGTIIILVPNDPPRSYLSLSCSCSGSGARVGCDIQAHAHDRLVGHPSGIPAHA
jgi:hypothetical protein